jgi:hypothetical protein
MHAAKRGDMSDLLSANPEILRVAVTMAVMATLLALGNRRLVVVPLMLQYVLVGTLVGGEITEPIFIIRVTLGVAISTIIYITSVHMDQALGARRSLALAGRASPPALPLGMGRGFRLLALALAMLMGYGLWDAYPWGSVPPHMALAACMLLAAGLALALISTDPLYLGIGAWLLLSGFETVYLSLEASLLVVALLGMLDILVALAVSFGCESWLDVFAQEPSP